MFDDFLMPFSDRFFPDWAYDALSKSMIHNAKTYSRHTEYIDGQIVKDKIIVNGEVVRDENRKPQLEKLDKEEEKCSNPYCKEKAQPSTDVKQLEGRIKDIENVNKTLYEENQKLKDKLAKFKKAFDSIV